MHIIALIPIPAPNWLTNNPIRLEGRGEVAQNDESVVAKRKYHLGRAVPERRVFGL